MDATAVTAWATVGLAAVGIVSLISTALVIRQNKKLVETTEREAKAVEAQAAAATEMAKQNSTLVQATKRQAEAVEEQARAGLGQTAAGQQQAQAAAELVRETQRNRELAYRPHLVIESRTPKPGASYGTGYVVKNIGSGPALNCRMAHHEFSGEPPQHDSWNSPLFDVGVGGAYEVTNAPGRWYDNVLDGLPGDGQTVDACVCEDQFGNRFRFAAGFEMRQPQPLDSWRPGNAYEKWADWYMALH